MTEADMIAALADGHRRGTHTVDGTAFADLDRPAAYRIQSAVLRALSATAAMLKTGIHGDGVGVAAPIYDSLVGRNGFNLPVANALGLEVEVGLVLGRNVETDSDIPAAVDRYFVGVEIVGSRFTDRKLAGLNGPLADNMSGLGYVIGTEPRRLKDIVDGLTVTLESAGKQIYSAPAKHGFGTVLASVAAYAKAQQAHLPLAAGTVITTGSLCGLVPISGAGHVTARLGDDTVEFDLV